ncbi:MAG: LptA/OstA family protein, partial [Stellaceae bacterium]
AGGARAQGLLPQDRGGGSDKPVSITADNGIEWQQAKHVYIARGNASATRGQDKVTADTLSAYYRSTDPAAPAAPKPGEGPANEGATQVYRIVADGHVRFTAPGETMTGGHAVYDLDTAALVVTGPPLEIVTERQRITARDSLEWYDNKQLGVARGDAVAVEGDRMVRADVLTARVEKAANGQSHIRRIDATGHVLVSEPGEIARGDSGDYDLDTGIVTLAGNVRLTRGENELRGRYGVVDMKTGVSRLLAAPPGAEVAGGGRVEGLIQPRHKAERE